MREIETSGVVINERNRNLDLCHPIPFVNSFSFVELYEIWDDIVSRLHINVLNNLRRIVWILAYI